MLDSISLERAGLPCAVICTEPFTSLCKAVAHAQGVEDFPFARTPHPIAGEYGDTLNNYALQVLSMVESILLNHS